MLGDREVQRNRKFYSLEAIFSVGFSVNSIRVVNILKNYSVRGYVLDNDMYEKWILFV